MLSKIWIALTAITALAHAAAINRLSPREQELDRALFKRQSVTQRKGTDIQILNFALALELIDISLFTGGLANFTQQDFLRAGFPIATRAEVEQVASDERAHAAFIQNAIITAGGTPIHPCQYQFPYTDVKSFIALGSIIEGVGSSAYIGSLAAFKDPQYATGAGGILGVEVRHNALLRALNGENPNSAPFDTPLSAQAVTSLAAGFYVPGSCPNGSALPFSPFPALNLNTNTRLVPGANIDVSPANSSTGSVADNSTLTNGTVFCAFASGLSVGYSTWGNGSCTIPTSNVTAGQTYLALTSTQSITDDSVIAGMAVLNIVDAKVPPLTSIFPNITATASRSCSKTSTPSQTSTPFAPSSSPVSQTA